MPLVACPKCSTNLKVPEGASGQVRCPKCQNVFKPGTKSQPAFEVVDEAAPKPAARPAPRPASPPPKAASKPAPADDFEVVEDKPAARKRVTAKPDDGDDDDRPRKKRRDDDDDDDDRPRSKKRRDDDDDDDDDDRPRKTRRRDDDDDDDDRPRSKKRRGDDDDDDDDDRPRKKKKRRDDYDYSPPGKAGKFGVGRVGLLLILISLGLYAGSMAIHALFLMIALIGGVIPGGLSLVTGILGLANWVVGAVGLGLCIGGPSRVRGLAIAALSVAVVQLVLAFIVVNDAEGVQGGSFSLPLLSTVNRAAHIQDLMKELRKEEEKNAGSARAKEIREEMKSFSDDKMDEGILAGGSSSRSKMRWYDLTTQQSYPDKAIAILSYESRYFSKAYYLLGLFAGLSELARLILMGIMLGVMAGVAKQYGSQSKAKIGWIVAASAAGGCMLIVLLTFVAADSYKDDKKDKYNPPPPPDTSGMSFEQSRQAHEAWSRQIQAEAEKRVEKMQSQMRSPFVWLGVGELLAFLIHIGCLVMPGLAAMQVYSATRRER